jgi:hypothetical protein
VRRAPSGQLVDAKVLDGAVVHGERLGEGRAALWPVRAKRRGRGHSVVVAATVARVRSGVNRRRLLSTYRIGTIPDSILQAVEV